MTDKTEAEAAEALRLCRCRGRLRETMAEAATDADAAAPPPGGSFTKGSAVFQSPTVKHPGDQMEDEAAVVLLTETTAGAEGWLRCSRCRCRCRCRVFGAAVVEEVFLEWVVESMCEVFVVALEK
jgi:hypothetical protein